MYAASQKLAQRPLLLSTIVFLDLETTGLPIAGFKPEITELCLLAASRFALEQQEATIRVQNKLNLCFHPTRQMQTTAASVSGLNLTNLFHQKDFDSTAVDLIQAFLSRLDPPVCLLAHNGYRFDYPLLRAELASVRGPEFNLTDCNGSPIVCSDSLPLFMTLSEELKPAESSANESGYVSIDRPSSPSAMSSLESPLAQSSPKKVDRPNSFRLGDLYARVFGDRHEHAHSAEGDCIAVLKLINNLGLSALDWLQTHYVNFNEIPRMYNPSTLRSGGLGQFPYKQSQPSTGSGDQSALNDIVSRSENIHLN